MATSTRCSGRPSACARCGGCDSGGAPTRARVGTADRDLRAGHRDGGAGLRAAIELAERGTDVIAVGKRPKTDAHTSLAAGGINAALATMDPDDTWQQHAADTLTESYLLADPATVQVVTEGAARGIG